MILQATHTTMYMYSEPVSICHTEVHLEPRACPGQRLLSHNLSISPEPEFAIERHDYFSNPVTCFAIHSPHVTVTITSHSRVELTPVLHDGPSLPWEEVRDRVRNHSNEFELEAYEFTFPSPLVTTGPEFAAYAAPSFTPSRPIGEAVEDLSSRIFHEFTYDQRATTITTPVLEVLADRHGVCQDFAHLMIACLRSLGLPARYVSGYLRSGENSIGAEASHAWLSVYSPPNGWLDIDPTNNVSPAGNHVTVAWGRDYSDVTPVKGVALGGGDQLIHVQVEVVPA